MRWRLLTCARSWCVRSVCKRSVHFSQVTLRLYGARAPRTLGHGGTTATHKIAEFIVGAAGDDGAPQWLCNTSPLPWADALRQPALQALWLRLTEASAGGAPPLLRRLPVDAEPPKWLRDCPTAQSARPHWVLRDPSQAPAMPLRCHGGPGRLE